MSTRAGARGPAHSAGLRASGVSKAFPGTQALDDVSLEIARGEIHGLVGGNGSGKSTLIKVLAGVHKADAGELEVAGRRVPASASDPGWALAAGLGFVHQDLGLFDGLSVAENLFVGLPYPRRGRRIDWRALNAAAREILEELDIDVAPSEPLAGLRASDRTLVAIGRALRGHESLHSGGLVLDEPTARLAAVEVERLLQALRGYAAQGQSILYVSHRLDEVMALSDGITVLRDGRVVACQAAGEIDHAELSDLVAGRSLSAAKAAEGVAMAGRPERADQAPALVVSGLKSGRLAGIDLTVRPGEIVGLAGLVGSGRSSLLRALFGSQPRAAGDVVVGGVGLRPGDTAAAVRAGIGYVPEDRAAKAAFLDLTVRENLAASRLRAFRGAGRLNRRMLDLGKERQACEQAIEGFGIRCRGPQTSMALLSGGNQQKVVLARWLASATRLLLLDEPTHGVDVGARAEIYRQVREAAATGLAVIVASSDADELLELCGRVLVMSTGRIAAEAMPPELDRHWLAEHVYGRDYLEEVEGDGKGG